MNMNKYLLLCLALLISAPVHSADFSADADHSQGRILCKICDEPQAIADCIQLSCGHNYCRECLVVRQLNFPVATIKFAG